MSEMAKNGQVAKSAKIIETTEKARLTNMANRDRMPTMPEGPNYLE